MELLLHSGAFWHGKYDGGSAADVYKRQESGYKRGYHFGLIASGDNHSVPAVSEFGSMAVLAENRTKDAIWDAMQKRHVYGVSNERIKLRMDLDGAMMGDCTSFRCV